MATGSITSLGIGSGLELQSILDQLKEVDQAQITAKETKITELETQVDAYNTVNAKLFSIKSDALNLSLTSNYLSNSVSITDEDIISATVGDGYDESSYSIDITKKASRNSWETTAVENQDDIMFAEAVSGIADATTTAVISSGTTLTMYYGTYAGISTDNSISAGTTDAAFTINETVIGEVTVDDDSDASRQVLVDAINDKTDEHGVTASVDEDGILTLVSADHSEITVTVGGGTETVLGGADPMSNTSQQQIDVTLTSGMTLSEIEDEINDSSNNKDGDGTQLVTASFVLGDDDTYYMRLAATSGGNSADSEINIDLTGLDWLAVDTTLGITQDETTMYLSVPPGTTYEETVTLINDADDNPGVTAAMINNGDSTTPYQLTLIADDTGEDARITLDNFGALTEVNGGIDPDTGTAESLNAAFTVDGISYSRQSNTSLTDVITGVTLNLKSEGESSLNIEVSSDTIKEDIMSMVEGFNDLISYLDTGSDTDTDSDADSDSDDTDNPFEGSTSANRIDSQLKTLLTTILDLNTSYTSLTDLGLEISSTGTISINEDTLDSAIAADYDAVQSLFLGDSDEEITGLADIINDGLTNMVSSTGIASTEIDQAEAEITNLDEDIEIETERLEKKYENMRKSFANLDTYISQLNAEASALTSMIDAFNSANE
ncbi:MAG: flagellar filament capping protein FliD [Desulfobacteraceae bacterium]|nr:flagellar filament capping protein FliD [Desulfobacteraceae bacterium]